MSDQIELSPLAESIQTKVIDGEQYVRSSDVLNVLRSCCCDPLSDDPIGCVTASLSLVFSELARRASGEPLVCRPLREYREEVARRDAMIRGIQKYNEESDEDEQ